MRYYIGKKECGCIVAGCVDKPEWKKDTAKTISGWIKDGLTVEFYEGELGPKLQSCKCNKKEEKEKLPLFV